MQVFGDRHYVMVVDDDVDCRESLSLALQMEGYYCVSASNGLEAHQLLSTANLLPDLIFLDMDMPIMSGPELIKKLEVVPHLREVPIVVISGGERFPAGHNNLPKPLSIDDVLNKLKKYHARKDPYPQ